MLPGERDAGIAHSVDHQLVLATDWASLRK
jgi:hypothetical protein